MTSREFCYWLQGYFEIVEANPSPAVPPHGLTGPQADMVRRHLALVFKHEIDPSYPNGPVLDAIHHPPFGTLATAPPKAGVVARC